MYFFCLLFAFLIVGCNQASRPIDLGPILVLDKEIVDLGDVLQGQPNRVTLQLQNHGVQPLKIGTLETSCTCTGADVLSNSISSNGTGELRVGVQPKSPGPGRATVKIHSNCSIHPVQRVQVRWNCVAPIEVVEPLFESGSVLPGSVLDHDVKVLCRTHLLPEGQTCRVREIVTNDPGCVFQGIMPRELSGDTPEVIGTMRITSGGMTGYGRARLMVQIDGALETELAVHATWRVVSPIEVSPQRLSLGESIAGTDKVQSAELIIHSHEGDIEVGSVHSTVNWLQTTHEPVTPKLVRLSVRRILDLPVGIHSGEIQIAMKSPAYPALTIPVSATISAAREQVP